MKKIINNKYKFLEKDLEKFIQLFDKKGEIIKDSRNTLKKFNCNEISLVIKSFQTPNFFNKVIYNFFRKGKAQRSFEHAKRLISIGINTPEPIAYFEERTCLFLKRSFYISEYISYDFSIREVINNFELKKNKKIIEAFTEFTFKLHENNINFLDHSPGNTLIKFEDEKPKFYLVDINRMKFENMKSSKRLGNFSRISKKNEVIKLISNQYSNLSGLDYEQTFDSIWENVLKFRYRFNLKKRLKNYFFLISKNNNKS